MVVCGSVNTLVCHWGSTSVRDAHKKSGGVHWTPPLLFLLVTGLVVTNQQLTRRL